MNRCIQVDEEYLLMKEKEYKEIQRKELFEYQNKQYKKQQKEEESKKSCNCCYYFCYYFWCFIYCISCFSCFCLTICVKLANKRKEAKSTDNNGKPTKDIIDDYGNVIGKNDKEFAITYYEFQLFEKNNHLGGINQRRFTRIANAINADRDNFHKSSMNNNIIRVSVDE